MSKDYTNEIGYESLLADFKRYQKQTPRGVGMKRTGKNIYLQFKTPNTSRKTYACSCSFNLDGMVEALSKANKVAEQLQNLKSEENFWAWYDKEIKGVSQLIDDRLTFGEAIKKVENDFWSRLSRTKRERSKTNHNDQASWYRTYECFYRHLPSEEFLNIADIEKVIAKQSKGTRNYKYVVSAMKKLATVNKKRDIYDLLCDIDVTQTVFADLQSIDLGEFINWRNQTLGISHKLSSRANIDVRKAWLWVFSTQVVYALRISEVFAIKNLTSEYITKDGVPIPALNDPENSKNLIYIGEKTNLGTTVKTGKRVARPQVPPKYPNLIELLEIKTPLIPNNKPRSTNSKKIADFHNAAARSKLVLWNAPFTQTHADRHLGNINGMQAGISQEIRAQSMGHSVKMNEGVYKKRQGTQTTIDLLLNSNQDAIDFVTALSSIKNLLKARPDDKQLASEILSIIYQKRREEIEELL